MKALWIACALLACACGDVPLDGNERTSTTSAALDAVTGFGSNPGNLAMYRYVPQGMPQNAPLVVALHGCTQTAADFSGNGLNALADKHKFYVVYPQQNTANNPVSCFDWWGQYNNPANKANITRGQGENLSIKQMVDKTMSDFSVDRSRVFVVGFSSGAAMAAVMLAAWPDVFAAGAIDAGVPYDCPSTSNSDVWQCMSPGKSLAASDWATRVKNAFPGYNGAYPRVTIWQGSQDTTVATMNEGELVKQWTAVHGLPATPFATEMIDGYPRSTYMDGNHRVWVESWSITGMPHGFAVDPANGCGTASQYLVDKKICTAKHIVSFFGIDAPPSADGGVGASDAGGARDGGVCCADASSGGGGGGVVAPDGGGNGDSCEFCARRQPASSCGVARGRGEGAFAIVALAVALAAIRRRRA